MVMQAPHRYVQPFGVATPGMILILLDQSTSMGDPAGKTRADEPDVVKAKMATTVVNRAIYDIQQSCQAGDEIRDRCVVGVIGYGAEVRSVVGGLISRVAEAYGGTEPDPQWPGRRLPVWVEPVAAGSTPMDRALDDARSLADGWIADHPDSFPPVVMNITDGDPDDLQRGGDGAVTAAAARRLTSLATSDGHVLLFNAHISSTDGPEVVLPSSRDQLPDDYARYLFDLSSLIPPSMLEKARRAGLSAEPGARGLVFNARRESLVKLLTFGSMPLLR
jgi:hypothetical protein